MRMRPLITVFIALGALLPVAPAQAGGLLSGALPGLVSPSRLATLRRLRRAPGSAPGWLRPAARAGVVAQTNGAWWRRGEPRWRSHRAWLLTD